MKTLYCFLFLLCVAGCVKDVTSNPGGRTDFVPGQIYVVKQPVFLWSSTRDDPTNYLALVEPGFGGTSTNLDEFIRESKDAPDVFGLLMPGEKIRVSKFIEDKSFEGGDMFRVYAIVITGEHKGAVVRLNLISKEGRPTSKAFRDPRYLEPIK